MAAERQEIIRICDCLCGGIVKGEALEGEGAEENVYCVPSEWAGYVALWDSSLGREENVFCSDCF